MDSFYGGLSWRFRSFLTLRNLVNLPNRAQRCETVSPVPVRTDQLSPKYESVGIASFSDYRNSAGRGTDVTFSKERPDTEDVGQYYPFAAGAGTAQRQPETAHDTGTRPNFLSLPVTLLAVFLEALSTSPGQFWKARRHALACEKILQDIPIGTIAEELGYADLFHFSRSFKKIEGISPRQYRQNNLDRTDKNLDGTNVPDSPVRP